MELRPYQKEDIIKLLTKPAMGIFNEQRTGKTPTSIMAMQTRGVEKLLIVCPASMVYKWAEEYNLWTGKIAYIISSATKYNAKPTNLDSSCIIINYENLRNSKRTIGCVGILVKKYKPTGLIIDEAHRIKDKKSANAMALDKFTKVPYKLALTGTPAPNKPWDIWSILHFLYPHVYKSYWNFIDEYFTKQTLFVSGKIIEEPYDFRPGMQTVLQQQLSYISIMRKRKEVMPWLPNEELPTIIQLPCTPSQIKYIEELTTYFKTEHINTQSVLEQLVRIRQICAAPAILGLRGSSPKIEWLQQYIQDYPEKNIIVFSNSKKFINLIRETIKTGTKQIAVITGDTSPHVRQSFINGFQSGEFSLIIIQTQAGKEGLTLDAADVTIFLDTYPPAADYLQAKDRMVPTIPERVKPQEIIHLMMKGTYDARLYDLVKQGIAATDIINDFINYLKGGK